MSHHLESTFAYSVDNFSAFFYIRYFEFLLQKDGRLLVGGFDDA